MKKYLWVICPGCTGDGKVENPAFCNGITSSEWSEMHDDEQSAYMRGDYDVDCQDCGGSGKVQVPNIAAMSFAEKRELVIQRREAQADRALDATVRAEQALGC